MIDANEDSIKNYEMFFYEGISDDFVASRLIKKGFAYYVARGRFNDLSSETAVALIDAGETLSVGLSLFPDEASVGISFANISSKVVRKLIENGQGYAVLNNIDSFPEISHREFVEAMLDHDQGSSLMVGIEKLTNLNEIDHAYIARRLMNEKNFSALAYNSHVMKLKGFDCNVLIKSIIESGSERDKRFLESLLRSFKPTSEIAYLMIEKGHGFTVIKNLSAFPESERNKINEKYNEYKQSH